MTPIQQLYLGVGAKKKTYLDDVFSTYLYKGTGSTQTINNGVNLSGEGGMVWIKQRGNATAHVIGDSLRGDNKYLASNSSNGQGTNTSRFKTLTTTGFQVGGDNDTGGVGNNYSSWSFRKAPGFFDVVTWTGNSTSRTISHNLGCVPGCIMIKKLDGEAYSWAVYHRETDLTEPGKYAMTLDNTSGRSTGDYYFDDTEPTASSFTVNTGSAVNGNGSTYVAYVFAGGESPAATARSVRFDSTGDYLSVGGSSGYVMGTGDFTIECWVKKDEKSHQGIWQISSTSGGLTTTNYANTLALGMESNAWQIYGANAQPSGGGPYSAKKWYHTAYVRQSGVSTLYINGQAVISQNDTTNYDGTHLAIGGYYNTSYLHKGFISNFRVVKGTAVYTSSFIPPTEPLANINNTKILCCNNSSTTGSTQTTGTITANGDPTASANSPFDDPEGFVFGDSGKENIIKCGNYFGNGDTDGPEVELGWEPQFLIMKSRSAGDWHMIDNIRGIPTDGDEPRLFPNDNSAEAAQDIVDLKPNGFKLKAANAYINGNGTDYIYIALRRSDGYVTKPADVGTDAFTVDYSRSRTTNNFPANFPVDFSFIKNKSSNSQWYTGARLTGDYEHDTSSNGTQQTRSAYSWDCNEGWDSNSSWNSNYYAWMWKRGQGFDVVTYNGDGTDNHEIRHNLGRVPEMVWVKCRNNTRDWKVYHIGTDGGDQNEYYALTLNENDAASGNHDWWNNKAFTTTHFTVGDGNAVNQNGFKFISMLWSSVPGISKVGYYTGTGSATTITTGFEPRFLLVKNSGTSNAWNIVDTARGWNSSNDARLWLNTTTDQSSSADIGTPTSTGFTLANGDARWNASGGKYIYYVHA